VYLELEEENTKYAPKTSTLVLYELIGEISVERDNTCGTFMWATSIGLNKYSTEFIVESGGSKTHLT